MLSSERRAFSRKKGWGMSDQTTVGTGSVIMNPDAYFKSMIPADTEPGVWRWKDIKAVLDEMSGHPKRYPAYPRVVPPREPARGRGAGGLPPLLLSGPGPPPPREG